MLKLKLTIRIASLLVLFVLIFSPLAKSQITFEKTIAKFQGKATFTQYGDKYFTVTSYSNADRDTISLYNADWSLFKQFYTPHGWHYNTILSFSTVISSIHEIESLSDKLYNNDTLIEFLISKGKTFSSGQ